MKFRNLILWGLLCLPFTLFAQESSEILFDIDSVPVYFNRQLLIYPQEKIYAQIDKPVYIAGEDIWFRAYVVNAAWHMPDTTSRYVYGELINPQNEIQNRVKVRLQNGTYQGHITLDEKLPGGDYKLRFYTRYLEGLGKDYFFERNIQIGTLATLTASQEKTPQRKRSGIKPMDYQVDFFPEGGFFPEGMISQIGFKALNEKGLGEAITGCVLNQKGDTIVDFFSNHLGMGSFMCLAKKGESFFAVCINQEGVEKRFPLPSVDENALALKTSIYKKLLYVTITRSFDFELPDSIYLLASCQGVIFYCNPWDSSREMVIFDETTLPQGIIQFLLIDRNGNPISERLIFNQQNPFPIEITFSTDKSQYKSREKVENVVTLTDADGVPIRGNFSVAVTDDRDVLPDSCVHILSALLLTSELKGYIEEPGYYFRNTSVTTLQNLDNLMLTQGWSRYEVKDVIKGRLQSPPVRKEISMQIAGQVKGGIFLNRTGEGYPVTLFSTSPFFYEETETDEDGYFLFDYFECPDSMTYVLQGRNRKGGLRTEMIYKEEKYPYVSPFIPVRENQSDSLTFKQYLQKADNQLLLTKGIRTIHLSDVVVTAEKKTSTGRSTYSSAFNERYGEDFINKRNPSTIFDLLSQLPGVTVAGDKAYITRSMYSSFSGETDALIVLDDVMVEQDVLHSIPVQSIEEVEVVKGGSAAIFGIRGGNGAIIITTKRGEFNLQQKESFHIRSITPLGYQITKQFYSPSYETVQKEDMINPDLRTTLYWNPDVKIGEEGKANFDFYTAESFSTYSVVIEGLTNDGRIIRHVEKIDGTLE